MKNITHHIMRSVGFFGVLFVLFVLGVNTASAATLNNDAADFATLRVSNYTDNPGCSNCWNNSVSADAGELVSFSIYYHNTSSETAHNVRVRLSPQSTGTGSSHTFNAYVWADNASQVSGSASVNLSSSESLSYNGSAFWYPNQTSSNSSFPNGQDGYDIFSSNGVNLGDIAPGWSTQGSVVVRFNVSGTNGGNNPSVTTNSASGITSSSATLNCYVDPQGSSNVSRWFEWGSTSSFGNTTAHHSHASSAASFSEYVSGLAGNSTYYFRCAAQNGSSAVVYGSTMSFSTSGSSNGSLPSVTTYSTSNTSNSFAVLEGYVNPNNSSDTSRWFEWGTDSWALNNSTTKIGQGSSAGTFSDTISGLSDNQTYYYRAVARNSYGTVYGGVQSFRTNDNGGTQRPFVSTYSATNVQQNSATFNGYVNPYNNSNTTRWFEYGTTNSLGNSTNRMSHGSTSSNFSDYVSGLASNTTYYYRAVAQNSYGTSYGNILSFTTGQGTVVSNHAPDAVTNLATNIGYSSARLNGLAVVYGNEYTSGWFEWGETASLGHRTDTENLGTAPTMSYKYSLFGLSANTTYYYRAVVQNSNGTDYGDIMTFRTNSQVITPVTPTTKTRTVSIEKEVENIVAQNGTYDRVEAVRGDLVRFTITVRNTGDYTLENVEIKDRVPYYLEFANAEDQNVNNPQREVVWFIGDLKAGERETVTLDMIVTANARIGSTIENVAQVETKRVTETSNLVEIEVVDVISSLGAAALFGGAGFLPDTLLEWLLLVIAILVLVVLSRVLYGHYEESKKKKQVAIIE